MFKLIEKLKSEPKARKPLIKSLCFFLKELYHTRSDISEFKIIDKKFQKLMGKKNGQKSQKSKKLVEKKKVSRRQSN